MTKSKPELSRLLSYLGRGDADDAYMSTSELASKMHMSRTSVIRALDLLGSYGYQVEFREDHGYRLGKIANEIIPAKLRKVLKARGFEARQVIYKRSLDSTQSVALRRAERKPSEAKLVVIAQTQTSSRGRFGRRWYSPAGGLWLSIMLRPKIPFHLSTILPFAVAVAVCVALKSVTGLEPKLKWPNDILIGDRKVAGILMDLSSQEDEILYTVIGIGINANFASSQLGKIGFRSCKPTSLFDQLRKPILLEHVTAEIVEQLGKYLCLLEEWSQSGQAGRNPIIEEWKRRSLMLGREVLVNTGSKKVLGIVKRITRTGSLVVQPRIGSAIEVTSGSVELMS
jgi:BirA family transcriptional regulator, biotin operon repressor / biotin---[acetyl-CoA-carboxylase] ligase